MKLLAIDKGNSRTKVGLQNKNGDLRISVFENNEENDLLQYIKSISYDAAVISSVAAGNLTTISNELKSKGKFLFVDSKTAIPLKNEYATPETLGTDRISGAIGAWKLVGEKDVLLMDAGTCINYECVINHTYKGGAIAPGLQMRLNAMHDYTGKLPLLNFLETETGLRAPLITKKFKADNKFKPEFTHVNEDLNFEVQRRNLKLLELPLTGNSTSGCMLSGAVQGMIFEMKGVADAYKQQYPAISIVLSGGDAPYLGKYLKNSIFVAHKEVVLLGLIEILKYNLQNEAINFKQESLG